MKKSFRSGFNYVTLIVLLIFLTHSSGAQQNFNADKQLFDYGWKFTLANQSDNYSAPAFDDRKWRGLDLPHDWSIEGKMEAKNPMGNDGGYFPSGIGWYRKTFSLPANAKINAYLFILKAFT